MSTLYYESGNHYSGRSSDNNSLQHWKYIKREKVNGKWRYWYEEDSEKTSIFGKKTTVDYTLTHPDGTVETKSKTITDGNKTGSKKFPIFESKTTITDKLSDGTTKTKTVTEKDESWEKVVAAGMAFIDKLFKRKK